MTRKLTSKQESFAQLVASGLAYSEAYRQSYNVAQCSPITIWQNSSTLAEHTQVALRVKELKATKETALATRRAWNQDRFLEEAEKNLQMSRELNQMGSANSALEIIGKATGLLSDKSVMINAVITHTDPELAEFSIPELKQLLGSLEHPALEGEYTEVEDEDVSNT